ncbi:hypothetical protein [Synechococcus sp. CB0101]|uniref:hypothetical protein n=1 Tax=Synechococcus sp. CB0101 TaxID=232348 RepID=UPI0002002649|nr:hypothetical protein [Synechococcus sp. CB0101]
MWISYRFLASLMLQPAGWLEPWQAPPDRLDPIALLEQQNENRLMEAMASGRLKS